MTLQVRIVTPEGVSWEGEASAVRVPAIDGEMEPTVVVTGGETLDLGDGTEILVHSIPGHTEGAVAYEIVGNLQGAYEDYMAAAAARPDWTEPLEQLKRFTVERRKSAQG